MNPVLRLCSVICALVAVTVCGAGDPELSLVLARSWLGLQLPSGFESFCRWPPPTKEEAESDPPTVCM